MVLYILILKILSSPIVEKVDFDVEKEGYSLCITDTKASHADLTDDYAAIPAEMKEVAQYFNKEFLNEIPADDFMIKFLNSILLLVIVGY